MVTGLQLSNAMYYVLSCDTTIIILPERFYFMSGVLKQEYSKLNQYRTKAYHRPDYSATYTPIPKKKRKVSGYRIFSIYNAYSRLNPIWPAVMRNFKF